MAEPTTQRMRMTFTVKRANDGRFFLACDPLESEPEPVISENQAPERDPAIPPPDPTETEAVIRGSESDPTLISGLFTFEVKAGVTEAQATELAERMTTLLSHLMFTPL
jgi:hypothetical protein